MCRTVSPCHRVGAVLGVLFTASPQGSVATVPAAPLDPGGAAVSWRQIAVKSDPDLDCPAASGWTVRHLFGSASDTPADLPALLRPYCLYVCEPDRADPADLCHEVSPAEVDDLELALAGLLVGPDRLAVVPLANPIDAVAPELAALFLEQAGNLELPGSPASPPTPVRLALLDTAPAVQVRQAPLASEHGPALEHLATALLCSGALCAPPDPTVAITSRLTLAYRSFDGQTFVAPDPVHGGEVGLISELAEAIHLEAQSASESSPHRLVINLSVGWHGGLFGGLEDEVEAMPADVRAVHAALEQAALDGAIVVAAAGNRPDLIEVGLAAGPWLPAGWEGRPSPAQGGQGTYRPLLYAAAAIDRDGHPLANAQPGSAAPLAAFGDHATVEVAPGDFSALLAGSSVATLAVSATAAAVWAYLPSLDPDQVMDAIYDAGESMPGFRSADFCLDDAPCPWPERSEVRRVSVCRAVRGACFADPFACPSILEASPDTCPTWPAVAAASSVDLSVFGTVRQRGGSSPVVDPGCDPDQVLGTNPPSGRPCPHRLSHGLAAQPWTLPQPQSNPCHVCIIRKDNDFDTVHAATGAPAGATVTSATLIRCPESPQPEVRPLDVDPSDPLPATFSVEVPPSGCRSALLAFEVTANGTTASSVVPLHSLP